MPNAHVRAYILRDANTTPQSKMESNSHNNRHTMQDKITVDGLTFVPYISHEEIERQVKAIASQLHEDLQGKGAHFICVLNGAFIFAADLFREAGLDDSTISFVRYKSYDGLSTTGNVKQLIGLTENIDGRDIVIVEDIVDTGLTATQMIADLKKRNPRSVGFVTLLHKPDSNKTGFKPDYVAFSIPAAFIIGYGLDLNGKCRNLKDIYIVKQ